VILPRLGHLSVNLITPSKIESYIAQRLKSVKRTTVHREISDIQAILNWSASPAGGHLIPRNPIAGLKKPKRDDEIILPPSVDEVRAVLKHAAPHLIRYIMIAYYTGLRPGRTELLNLKWDNVDFERERIRVISAEKGGLRFRDVPIMDDYFFDCLNCWYESDLPDPEYLIHYKGRPVASVKTAWKNAKKSAGITRRIRLYDIRHSFTSYLLDSGADLKSVSELIGHKDINLTLRIYQHTSAALRRQTVKKLPTLAAGNIGDSR